MDSDARGAHDQAMQGGRTRQGALRARVAVVVGILALIILAGLGSMLSGRGDLHPQKAPAGASAATALNGPPPGLDPAGAAAAGTSGAVAPTTAALATPAAGGSEPTTTPTTTSTATGQTGPTTITFPPLPPGLPDLPCPPGLGQNGQCFPFAPLPPG